MRLEGALFGELITEISCMDMNCSLSLLTFVIHNHQLIQLTVLCFHNIESPKGA